jgi:hypothetical protein
LFLENVADKESSAAWAQSTPRPALEIVEAIAEERTCRRVTMQDT